MIIRFYTPTHGCCSEYCLIHNPKWCPLDLHPHLSCHLKVPPVCGAVPEWSNPIKSFMFNFFLEILSLWFKNLFFCKYTKVHNLILSFFFLSLKVSLSAIRNGTFISVWKKQSDGCIWTQSIVSDGFFFLNLKVRSVLHTTHWLQPAAMALSNLKVIKLPINPATLPTLERHRGPWRSSPAPGYQSWRKNIKLYVK